MKRIITRTLYLSQQQSCRVRLELTQNYTCTHLLTLQIPHGFEEDIAGSPTDYSRLLSGSGSGIHTVSQKKSDRRVHYSVASPSSSNAHLWPN
jgi:hypothetical protein